MAVNTKQVMGRRELRYNSYDDLLADVNELASGETEMVGNWSLAQVCKHLASSLNSCIDGIPFNAPLLLRVMGKLFLKKKFLTQAVPAGFQIPGNAKKQFEPEESADLQEQLPALRKAIERVKNDKSRVSHPVFGQLSADEWDQFNLRHAEMHMSFIKPA
jgi:hypothetical protein